MNTFDKLEVGKTYKIKFMNSDFITYKVQTKEVNCVRLMNQLNGELKLVNINELNSAMIMNDNSTKQLLKG